MIFVDTSFWVALRNRNDANHEPAVALAERTAGASLLTTNHVRAETWTYLRRKAGHASAVGFLDAVEGADRLHVAFVSAEQEEAASRWLRAHDERAYSFVDATSFAVMKAMRVREALTFDADFSAAGFTPLQP